MHSAAGSASKSFSPSRGLKPIPPARYGSKTGGAVGEGDLELARQAVGEVEAVERVREGARIRRDVEDRIGEQPGVGADQRVAEGVAAAAAEAEAGRFASFERGRDLGGRDAVELEVLSGGEMGEIAAVAAEDRRRRAEVVG